MFVVVVCCCVSQIIQGQCVIIRIERCHSSIRTRTPESFLYYIRFFFVFFFFALLAFVFCCAWDALMSSRRVLCYQLGSCYIIHAGLLWIDNELLLNKCHWGRIYLIARLRNICASRRAVIVLSFWSLGVFRSRFFFFRGFFRLVAL